MTKITKDITHVYTFQHYSGDYRQATVVFINSKFKSCVYSTESNIYSVEDWIWLGDIAKTIQDLIKKEECVKP